MASLAIDGCEFASQVIKGTHLSSLCRRWFDSLRLDSEA